jgi:hypothetical protein
MARHIAFLVFLAAVIAIGMHLDSRPDPPRPVPATPIPVAPATTPKAVTV